MPVPRSILSAPLADHDLQLAAGRWPEGLTGEIVLAAPRNEEGLRYALFGQGHVIRLSLAAGAHGAPADRFAWRVRRIASPSARLADRRPDAFPREFAGRPGRLGMPNLGNTAPLVWGERLFATWDVGRPIEVDPVSLDFLGEVGHRRSWGESLPAPGPLPAIVSTAHPVIDPERDCLWTVKLALAPGGMNPHVVRWDGEGPELRSWPLAGVGYLGTMHTISQTPDWLVLADSGNFKPDPADARGGGERSVRIDESSPVWLVRKETLEATPPGEPVAAREVRIAPPTGHFYAVHAEGDRLRLLFEHMDLLDLGFHLRPDDRDAFGRPLDPSQAGFYSMAMAPSTLSELEVDVETGRVTDLARVREDWTWNLQLSAMDWSPAGLAGPTHHHVVYQGWRPGTVAKRVLDFYGDRVDAARLPAQETNGFLASFERGGLRLASRHAFAVDDLPSSPVFVPRAGGAPGGGDGWVVVPVLSDAGLRVEVFDAAEVGKGPVATLAAPGGAAHPLLLHAYWLPEARPAQARDRLRFSDELDAASLAGLDPDLVDDVRSVARELDAERP